MIDINFIQKKLGRLQEVEHLLSMQETIANQKTYMELVREHGYLKRLEDKAVKYLQMIKDISDNKAIVANDAEDSEIKDLASKELLELESSVIAAERELMIVLLPPDPSDRRNAIMEIRAGTGGNEAALFAGDLFRMYTKYIQNKGWKLSPIDTSVSEIGGYKEIVFSVEGEGAYSFLKYESGGHRVQRVPETEAQGRIHTSAATVAVFPEVDQDDNIEIKPDEIRIDTFCSSGPGGQSVNTTYSAIRITHLPTGVVAQSQDERSQQRNREKALSVLKSRLLDLKRREEEEKKSNSRKTQIGSGDRSERIRTYNFPQNRLTDHRINLTLYSLDNIIEGQIDELISALKQHDVEMRMKDETISTNSQ